MATRCAKINRCGSIPDACASRRRFSFAACLEQPEYALPHSREQTHPNSEGLRQDLISIVETTEDEPAFRQVARCARGRISGLQASGVTGEGSMRHVQRALDVELLQLFRQTEAVGEDVVVPRRTEGALEADGVYLQGRRAKRKDLRAR